MLRFDAYTRDRTGPQPGLVVLWDYVHGRWPAAEFLGIYAARNMRGSTARSLHAEGRALDARLPSPHALDELVALLVSHADRLNVQAVNHYPHRARWRVDRGWTPNGSPGAPGSTIHIERNWDGARDTRPIAELVNRPASGGAVKITAMCAVPWARPLRGRIPVVRAELQGDGTTHVVGYGVHLAGGKAAFGVVSLVDVGKLAAPIESFTVDPPGRRVIGVAADLGTFAVQVL